VPIFSPQGVLAVAAVVDIALQKDNCPIAAKQLAARHGLPSRYLAVLLRRLVRAGILQAFRGPAGGYGLVEERDEVTVHDIFRAATNPKAEPNSELLKSVVLPVLSAAEEEFRQALSRITLDDIVKFASLNGYGAERREPSVDRNCPDCSKNNNL
jgi:Rrf2 family transcriptional regulator, iron-sulfur cluster assembly transcription factor